MKRSLSFLAEVIGLKLIFTGEPSGLLRLKITGFLTEVISVRGFSNLISTPVSLPGLLHNGGLLGLICNGEPSWATSQQGPSWAYLYW